MCAASVVPHCPRVTVMSLATTLVARRISFPILKYCPETICVPSTTGTVVAPTPNCAPPVFKAVVVV